MYSLLKHDAIDFAIFIPNACGIVFSIIQSLTWYYFWKKKDGEVDSIEKKFIDEEN